MRAILFRLSSILVVLFSLGGCIVGLIDVRPRGDDIVYDSYTEAYDEAYEECTNNPRLADKTLGDCLKMMDFKEGAASSSMDDLLNEREDF